MKMTPKCTYCLLSRVHYQCELAGADLELTHNVMKECLKVLYETYDPSKASVYSSTAVHRKCYEVLNNSDPYKDVKRQNNKTALEILPFARTLIYGADDSGNAYTFETSPFEKTDIFRRAALISVIGNYFDFGISDQKASDEHFKKEFLNFFKEGFFTDDTETMYRMLENTVYLADNCGEIVFDREFIQIIKKLGGKVTLIVRGKPILTDATVEEVKLLQIDRYADKILTTGTDSIGICLKEAPKETKDAMKSSSLIISKGMANYESLSDENYKPIAYLLRTKCTTVSESIGTPLNKSIAKLCY